MLPLGFTDEEQFLEAMQRFRAAAGVEDALVSDTLYQQGLASGANDAHGALRVGATQRHFPALAGLEKSLSIELGRKTTVRIFSRAGYDLIKAATDIVGA